MISLRFTFYLKSPRPLIRHQLTGCKNLITYKKKAIRRIEYCINFEDREDTDVLCDKYKIENLRLRRKRNLAKIMYTQSTDVQNLKVDTIKMNLRSKKNVHMKTDFTSIARVHNSPLYRGLRLWDSLPSDIQKDKEVSTFKKKISTYTF